MAHPASFHLSTGELYTYSVIVLLMPVHGVSFLIFVDMGIAGNTVNVSSQNLSTGNLKYSQ